MINLIKNIEKIALVLIIFATVIAIGYEIHAMYEKSLVELADLLLLFIYLEVIQSNLSCLLQVALPQSFD